MYTFTVCTFHEVTEGKITVCCDNETGLWLSSIKNQQVPLATKHSDLIRAIRKIVAALPVTIHFQDVMSHQDDHDFYDNLDRPSQLNVLMDAEAKQYLRHLITLEEDGKLDLPQHNIFREGWSCWLGDVKVTSEPIKVNLHFIYLCELSNHCNKNENLPFAAFDTIKWDAIVDATSSNPELFNLWMTKHVSGQCAEARI
jgi:hypothetical protein